MDPRPNTQFARNGDVEIAYQVVGDGPIDVVLVPGFMSHVDLNWEYSFYEVMLSDIASYARLVVLDKRGTGLSSRAVALGTFEERMDDVRAVMDAAGVERAMLIGISEGGAMAALMAATYPGRVASLVLIAAACPGVDAVNEGTRSALLSFVRDGWYSGKVLNFFVQHPANRAIAVDELARFERYCCEPAVAEEIMARNVDSDIRNIVSSVAVPTLVLHNRRDPVVPISHGEFYASQIAGAKHQFFEADFHGSWRPSDSEATLKATREFLTGEAITKVATFDRILSTVLFTDIVDSTSTAAGMGDAGWREVLDLHDAAVAEEIERFRGTLVKSTGDGLLAHFDGPSRAVLCADALRRRATSIGIAIRAGAHTGEIELRGNDVGGIAVHIASRVASLADAGEILVSRTVKDLSIGSGLIFSDRGEQALKGVPDTWQLFAATTIG